MACVQRYAELAKHIRRLARLGRSVQVHRVHDGGKGEICRYCRRQVPLVFRDAETMSGRSAFRGDPRKPQGGHGIGTLFGAVGRRRAPGGGSTSRLAGTDGFERHMDRSTGAVGRAPGARREAAHARA